MTERLSCLVPYCRRTRGVRKGEPPIRPGEEWICGPHWRLVPRRLKLLRTKARRRGRRRLWWLVWDRCKRTAIEAAAGLR